MSAFGNGFGYGLARGSAVHPRAAAYRAALVAAGVVPTGSQMAALSRFYARCAGLAPCVIQSVATVWGNAAANAVSLFTSSYQSFYSGTFDFTGKQARCSFNPGFLDMGFDPLGAGMSPNNASLGVMILGTPGVATDFFDIGSRVGGGTGELVLAVNYNGDTYAASGETFGLPNYLVANATGGAGLYAFNCSASGQQLTKDTGSGPAQLGTRGTNTGALSNLPVRGFKALLQDNSITGTSPREYGAFYVAKGMTHAQADVFSASVYQLITRLRA